MSYEGGVNASIDSTLEHIKTIGTGPVVFWIVNEPNA